MTGILESLIEKITDESSIPKLAEFRMRRDALEKEFVEKALLHCGGIQSRAAKALGITERIMWHLVDKYGIDVNQFKPSLEKAVRENIQGTRASEDNQISQDSCHEFDNITSGEF